MAAEVPSPGKESRPPSTVLAGLSAARSRLDRTSTVARLAGVLRGRIAEGGLPPGTQLAEHAVAEALGVSRNTLRETFRLLAHEGLIVHEPHRGVFVRTPGEADVRDIYATRRFVECAAVHHAPGASPELLAEIRAAVDRGELAAAAQRWTDVGAADLEFHSAIVALAGSRRLDEMMTRVLAELRLVFHMMADPHRFHEPYLHRNAEIATLLENGRLDAAADTLTAYLDDAERQLLSGIAERRP
jgi:DNA-binding GntR family transcriptional regulator